MATLPVKWYRGGMYGLVSWTTGDYLVAGKLVSLLDQLLVNGFGTISIDSFVVSSGIATITRSVGMVQHYQHQVIELMGSSGHNGQYRVLDFPSGTTMRVLAPGVSDGSATGTLTIKTPGLGWEIAFTGTNKRVYRSPNTNSPRSYYRVDDTRSWGGTPYGARVQGYTAMSDVDTGTTLWTGSNNYHMLPAIYFEQGGVGYTFNAFGDDRTFYFMTYGRTLNSENWKLHGFGDFESFKQGDVDNEITFMSAYTSAETGNHFGPLCGHPYVTSGVAALNCRLRRDALGNYGAWAHGYRYSSAVSGASVSWIYSGTILGDPWFTGAKLLFTDALIVERNASDAPLRGKMRGIYWVLNREPMAADANFQWLDSADGLPGRQCALGYHVTTYLSGGSPLAAAGRYVVDITGPWD